MSRIRTGGKAKAGDEPPAPRLASDPSGTAVHANAPAPPRFELRDDGLIVACHTDADAPGEPAAGPSSTPELETIPRLVYRDDARGLRLYHGDCLDFLDAVVARYPEGHFDTIFADPPYFLSNGGITCHAGRMVNVDKGRWDKSQGLEATHSFNLGWLRRCQQALKPNGTIWVSGTLHVIFSVGYALQQLGFRILNDITWEKPNPPPNLGCRCFTHSTETVLWAARSEASRHTFNYQQMRELNRGKQMKTVWTITSATGEEKSLGKHPTQKPIALVERCLLASTNPGDLVLDPFMGAGTTAVAALRTGRRCFGVDSDRNYIELAIARLEAEGQKPGDLFATSPRPAGALL